MAKGAESKVKVTEVILKTFNNSFLYNDNKEIRIPMIENGEEIEIKVALSCAKTAVRQASFSGTTNDVPSLVTEENPCSVTNDASPQISDEDRAKVKELMAKLGF